MKKILTILFILFSFASFSQKQDSIVTIKGVVVAAETGELLPFANVIVYNNCVQKNTVQTDFDGKFKFKTNIKNHVLITFVGAKDTIIEVKELIEKNKIILINNINYVGLPNYKLLDIDVPFIDKETTTEHIDNATTRSINQTINIKGVVIETETKEHIPLIGIYLKDLNDSIILYQLSNLGGYFNFCFENTLFKDFIQFKYEFEEQSFGFKYSELKDTINYSYNFKEYNSDSLIVTDMSTPETRNIRDFLPLTKMNRCDEISSVPVRCNPYQIYGERSPYHYEYPPRDLNLGGNGYFNEKDIKHMAW